MGYSKTPAGRASKARGRRKLRPTHGQRVLAAQTLIREAKAGGCVFCGEEFHACLHLHHLDPKTKAHKKDTASYAKTVAKARKYIQGCIVVCANCHAKIHHGVLKSAHVPLINRATPQLSLLEGADASTA